MIETRDVPPYCHAGLNSDIADWQSLKNFDLLAFTSVNGVESFFKQLMAAGLDVRVLAGKKIASVGKITEKKLLERGIRCDYVPEVHTGAGLGEMLRGMSVDSSKVLLLQGNLADDTLVEMLPQATRWVVYETLPVKELPEWKREAVASADAVVFASSSAVENFCAVTQNLHFEEPLQSHPEEPLLRHPEERSDEGSSPKELCHASEPSLAFCIGRMTESAARKHGFDIVTSDETTMDSLVKKIVDFYTRES